MPVLHSPDTAFSKESVKWEAQWTPMGPPLRPYQKRLYPMAMFLAGRPPGGLGPDTILETCEVGSEAEETFPRSRGFRPTPLEALAAFAAQQLEYATLAAERNYDVKKKLSRRAAAEVATAEARAVDHLPSVPETPVRRRARHT